MKRKIKESKVGDSEVIRVKNREGVKVSFRVVRIKLRNGSLKYRVQWTEPIKGIKKKDRGDKRFNERWEVESFVIRWEEDESAIAGKYTNRPTTLTQQQLKDAEYAIGLLPDQVTLQQAAQFYLDGSPNENKSVQEAYDAWMTSGKDEENLRKISLDDRRNSLREFIKKYGWQSLIGVNEEMVRTLIFKRGRKPQTAIGYLSNFKAFFNFCIKREWLKKSPIHHLSKPKIDIKVPEILTVEEARRLIEVASAHRDGIILAYFSIALFCGIRPAEIHGGLMRSKASKETRPITWEDMELDSENPVIRLTRTKGRRPRIVPIPPNCVALLRSVKQHPIFPKKNGRTRFKEVIAKAGLTDWINDCCRHSWASYYYASNPSQAPDMIARVAGNSGWVLEQHYINPKLSKTDGEEFFQLSV